MEQINVSAAVQAAKQLNAAIGSLTARKADLVAQRKTLDERTRLLYRMPLLRSEVKAAILKSIDTVGAEFPGSAKWHDVFRGFAFPKGNRPLTFNAVNLNPSTFIPSEEPINLQDLEAIADGGHHRVIGMGMAINFFSGANESLGALEARRAYFFFGDIIKEKVSEHFDTFFPERFPNAPKTEVLTIEQRREEIEKNDEQIAVLDEELERVDGQLQELADASPPVKGRVGF